MLKFIITRIYRKIGFKKNKNRSGLVRKDVTVISVQPHLEFIVYWKVLKIGKGPAAVLKAYGKEVIKFDCFGLDKGHYHVAPHYGFRIFFYEASVEQQIERTGKELRENAKKYLGRHSDKRIRSLKINEEKFSEKITEVQNRMTCFINSVPRLNNLK